MRAGTQSFGAKRNRFMEQKKTKAELLEAIGKRSDERVNTDRRYTSPAICEPGEYIPNASSHEIYRNRLQIDVINAAWHRNKYPEETGVLKRAGDKVYTGKSDQRGEFEKTTHKRKSDSLGEKFAYSLRDRTRKRQKFDVWKVEKVISENTGLRVDVGPRRVGLI